MAWFFPGLEVGRFHLEITQALGELLGRENDVLRTSRCGENNFRPLLSKQIQILAPIHHRTHAIWPVETMVCWSVGHVCVAGDLFFVLASPFRHSSEPMLMAHGFSTARAYNMPDLIPVRVILTSSIHLHYSPDAGS